VPLAQIEAVGVANGANAAQALLAIDADLAASIERLQRARAEIRAILEGATATDVPAGFEGVAGSMSGSDRSLMLIYSQLYDESAMSDLRQMAQGEPDETSAEFDALPADADEATRHRLAEALAPQLAQHLSDFPWLMQPAEHLSKGERVTQETFLETFTELYNEAQLHVLGRASVLATEHLAAAAANDEGEPHDE
jgi:hypothetical protein